VRDKIAIAAEHLRLAHSVAVLTGAGVSAESGIPTFRDALTGLWSKYDPTQLATPEAFARDAALVCRWYDERRLRCATKEPNAAHHALVAMERRVSEAGGSFTLITQNVDGLHARAGSRNLVEIHGSLSKWRCTGTGFEFEAGPEPFDEHPPRSASGHPMRPGVVWFGEALPARALARAMEALSACDLFVSIGTSAVVYPAAGFVHVARQAGAVTIEINAEATPISSDVDLAIHARAGEALPAIVAAW
jgi:NAD-dependent deacetylase